MRPSAVTEPTFPLPAEILDVARKAGDRGLCDECFGRLVGRWGHGLTNPERANRLRAALAAPASPVETACRLCRGTFARYDLWVDRSIAAAPGVEWHRFSCGSRWDPEILATEEALWGETGSAWGESARGAFNRELGKRIAVRTGAEGTIERPDVTFVADIPVGRVELTILPLYIAGRYRKHDRTLPQTRWPCRRCDGRGCDRCGGTGKMYAESVEELVAAPFLRATSAEATRFHGMGREDIDARMLGDGRPFVLELVRPKRRTIDLAALAADVATSAGGRVEVMEIAAADATTVVRLKEATPEKSYRVEVVGDVAVAKINEALTVATGRAIAQRTPTRVAHRRSDRVRTRRIVAARLVTAEAGRFTLDLRAEAGTYIKEWVEGDGGRTEPSLAQLVAAPLHVGALDVIAIHDRDG